MFGYILLVILMVGAWVLLGIGIKKDINWAFIIGYIFTTLFTAVFLITSIKLGMKHCEAVSFEDNRNLQQELIYSINGNMSPQTINKIISDAVNINERIEKNKSHCNSVMWGIMYNKGIAEVDLIEIPKLKYQIVIEE